MRIHPASQVRSVRNVYGMLGYAIPKAEESESKQSKSCAGTLDLLVTRLLRMITNVWLPGIIPFDQSYSMYVYSILFLGLEFAEAASLYPYKLSFPRPSIVSLLVPSTVPWWMTCTQLLSLSSFGYFF